MSTGYVEGTIPPVFDDARKRPIEATGDRAVLVLDGRLSTARLPAVVIASECARRGYVGYRVFKGASFSDSKPVSGYWPVPRRVDRTAASAAHGG